MSNNWFRILRFIGVMYKLLGFFVVDYRGEIR